MKTNRDYVEAIMTASPTADLATLNAHAPVVRGRYGGRGRIWPLQGL